MGTTNFVNIGTAGTITGETTFSGGTIHPDDVNASFGTDSDFIMDWETSDADAHYFNMALGASRNIVISEDQNVDWGHATSTDPTLWIHSSDATDTSDYIAFSHDQTNAVIDWGNGSLSLAGGAVSFVDGITMTLGAGDDTQALDISSSNTSFSSGQGLIDIGRGS